MHFEQRLDVIKNHLEKKEYLSVVEMAKFLGVSLPTIRKDFEYLSEINTNIIRVHGGVKLRKSKSMNINFEERELKNIELKKEIATKAIRYIKPYDTILLDSSSTSYELAKLLSLVNFKVTVITDGISTAMTLKENPYLFVIIVGGVVKPNSNSIDDDFDSNSLELFHIDKYFLSASGVSAESGLSEYNLGEIRTKEKMIKKTNETFVLIDSSKFEIDSNLVFAKLENIDYLITDSKADINIIDIYAKLVSEDIL